MNKFTKGVMFGACMLGAVGALSACGKTPEPPKSETYNLVFDVDGNLDTTEDRITKSVAKNAFNDKTQYPALTEDEQSGYAREWSLQTWSDENTALLVPESGTGDEYHPYLISTEAQLKKMVESVGTTISVKYFNGQDEVTSSDNYNKRVTTYATVIATETISNGSTTSWSFETNKQFFRLINDINVEDETMAATGSSSVSLDGTAYNLNGTAVGKYSINNVNSSNLTEGYLFDCVVDSDFINFNVNLNQDVVQIASYTRGGVYNAGEVNERRDTTNFENISIGSNGQTITQTGDNSSAFISHVMTEASLNMIDCEMNVAKINSESGYAGIFVGGYPKTNGKVTFENCVNNADITSTGSIGIFFGNRRAKANNSLNDPYIHEVINCKNTGTIIANENSHVLAGIPSSSNQPEAFTEDECKSLDNCEDPTIFVHTDGGSLTAKNFENAIVDGNTIVLPSITLNLEEGKTYTIIVNVENCLQETVAVELGVANPSSFTTNIAIEYEVTSEDLEIDGSYTIADIYSCVADVSTYCEFYGVDASTIEWADGGSCEYYWDKTNHCFVINTTEYTAIMKNINSETGYDVKFSVAVMDGETLVDVYTVANKTNEFESQLAN